MDSLYSNIEGKNNTANGVDALYSNDTGSYNTATDAYALAYFCRALGRNRHLNGSLRRIGSEIGRFGQPALHNGIDGDASTLDQ